MSLPHPDGVGFRLIVHGNEPNGFLGVLRQDEGLEGSVVHAEALFILEDAVDLDLNAPCLPVANVRHNLHPTIFADAFLKAGACDRALNPAIHIDKLGVVLEIVFGGVLRGVGPARRAASLEENGGGN